MQEDLPSFHSQLMGSLDYLGREDKDPRAWMKERDREWEKNWKPYNPTVGTKKKVTKQPSNMSNEKNPPGEEQKEVKKVEANGTRTFYAKIAIVGPSGTGKSYLSKTLSDMPDVEETGYINIERKPLSYRQKHPFKYLGQPKTWGAFKKNLEDYGNNPAIKQIIADSQTMALNILNKEMSQNFTGFDIYKNYNRQVYEYLELLKNIQKDVIILSHDEIVKLDEGSKVKRMAVHGKEFEGKIEQHFTVVLNTGTRIKDSKPQYFLRTFEPDTSAKVPEGLFSADGYGVTPLEIPNDGKFIIESVKKYYTI